MKRFAIILVASVLALYSWGQTRLSAEQQRQILEKIDKSSSAMIDMQGDFTQTKSMKLMKKEMISSLILLETCFHSQRPWQVVYRVSKASFKLYLLMRRELYIQKMPLSK